MELRNEFKLSYLFISHNLSVIRFVSKRIAVMYLGKIVELTDKKELYEHPAHPYTQALLSAIPKLNRRGLEKRIILAGSTPSIMTLPRGAGSTRGVFTAKRFVNRNPSYVKSLHTIMWLVTCTGAENRSRENKSRRRLHGRVWHEGGIHFKNKVRR